MGEPHGEFLTIQVADQCNVFHILQSVQNRFAIFETVNISRERRIPPSVYGHIIVQILVVKYVFRLLTYCDQWRLVGFS